MEPGEGALHGAVLHDALHQLDIYETMKISRYGSHAVHYAPLLAMIRVYNRLKKAEIHSVVDIGSGVGFGVKAMWSLGLTATGVDISPFAIKMAN